MNSVLQVNNLTKKYKVLAVNNLNFSIDKGNVYGILGPNGSGKSTTFGMLLTTVQPTGGSWEWFGKEGTDTATLKRMGAIIEQPNFYPYLSALDNLKIVAQIKGVPYNKIEEKLQLVNLLDRKKEKFKNFSLGMKQRLSIASALLNDPEILILDEPTNGLDPEGIIQIRNLIQHIASKGITIFIASHLLDEIEKICTHVLILKQGTAIYSGEVSGVGKQEAFYELRCEDISVEKLADAVKNIDGILEISIKDNLVIATATGNLMPAQLNKILVQEGIHLSQLVHKKHSLETNFLQLIQNPA